MPKTHKVDKVLDAIAKAKRMRDNIKDYPKNFDASITSISEGKYRRIAGPYISSMGDIYTVDIYSCANGLIRADFRPIKEEDKSDA